MNARLVFLDFYRTGSCYNYAHAIRFDSHSGTGGNYLVFPKLLGNGEDRTDNGDTAVLYNHEGKKEGRRKEGGREGRKVFNPGQRLEPRVQ